MHATRSKLICATLIAIWGYAFWPILHAMYSCYWSTGYDYQGLIVVPLMLGLIKLKNTTLRRATINYSPSGLLFLLLASLIWLFATITKLTILEQIALLSMIPAIVLTTYGRKVTGIIIFPLLCVFLLLPISSNLVLALQNTLTWLLVKSLALTQQAVYWEDNYIYVGNKEYQIVKLLGALRYAMIYIAFGAVYAFLINKKLLQQICITLSFIIMPFIFLLCASFGLMQLQLWSDLTSWVFVSLGLFSAMLLGLLLRSKQKNRNAGDSIDWHSDYVQYKTRWLLATTIASVILISVPFVAQSLAAQAHYTHAKQQSAASNVTSWQTVKSQNLQIRLAHNKVPVIETILKNKGDLKITWNSYYINGHLTTNKTWAQVLENLYALTRQGADSSIVTVEAAVSSDVYTARHSLEKLLQARMAKNCKV